MLLTQHSVHLDHLLTKSIVGSDATTHLAEEIRDADIYVPVSLFWSHIGNGIMAIAFIITYLFAMPDINAAINDPSGFPFLYVFKSTMSTTGLNTLTTVVLLIIIAGHINFGASTGRQIFAFARDKGLPFSGWIAKVDHKKEIPANAILLSNTITCLLSLINIGSTRAFEAFISLQVVSLMFIYSCSLSCVLYRRIYYPHLLPVARWSLGRWGPTINIFALAYTVFAFFWPFWPNTTPVTAGDFNLIVVMFIEVFILALVMYFVQWKNVYVGPVKQCRMARLEI